MITNTCCSKLKLDEQTGPCEYQQKLQLNTSTCSNVNSINETSKNKYPTLTQTPTSQLKSTNDFTFYASSGYDHAKNASASVDKSKVGQSSTSFYYEPCSYYNLKQENILTRENFNISRNASAFNDVEGIIHGSHILTCDTTSIFCSSNINSCSSKTSKSFRKKTTMYRTEDQEHACRQIEDVHNYSKLNRYDYSKDENNRVVSSRNSTNQDDDDDEEEDNEEEEKEEEEFNIVDYGQSARTKNISANPIHSFVSVKKSQPQHKKQDLTSSDRVKIENEGYVSPPDHHARRPMNAFLIFCKRHRGIVKDKYKNYENRSITKILGEWWASLDANDKKCYVNLAKQILEKVFGKRTKTAAIIKNVIRLTHKEELVEKLKCTKFSVMIDESTDVTSNKSTCIVVRYYDPTHSKTVSSFFDLVDLFQGDVDKASAKVIHEADENAITKHNIPLDNVIGFGSDGCNTIFFSVGRC